MVQILHILPFLHVKLEHCAVRVLVLQEILKLSQGQLVLGLQVVICCLTRSFLGTLTFGQWSSNRS